jgi:hypothetical protein
VLYLVQGVEYEELCGAWREELVLTGMGELTEVLKIIKKIVGTKVHWWNDLFQIRSYHIIQDLDLS